MRLLKKQKETKSVR